MRAIPVEETLKNIKMTSNEFIKLYVDDEWSLPDFKKKFNLSYRRIQKILNHFGVDIRNRSKALNLKKCRKKFVDTVKEKYGECITNPSQLEEVKEKKKKTFLSNYGVDNSCPII
jgi:predicted DNA-binding protein YlxM (UPF0122 family)